MHTHTHIRTHNHAYTHTHARMHARTRTHTHTHTIMHTHAQTHTVHTYTCTCIQIQIEKYKHIYSYAIIHKQHDMPELFQPCTYVHIIRMHFITFSSSSHTVHIYQNKFTNIHTYVRPWAPHYSEVQLMKCKLRTSMKTTYKQLV